MLKWGTGGINIDGGRIGTEAVSVHDAPKGTFAGGEIGRGSIKNYREHKGRFPANLILSEQGAEELDRQSGVRKSGAMTKPYKYTNTGHSLGSPTGYTKQIHKSNEGGASRFFYVAKASKRERNMGCEGLGEKNIDYEGRKGQNNSEFRLNGSKRKENMSKNNHPTVKPLKLMEYLVKLVTPPKGTTLDPFIGSGTTGIACKKLGFNYIGIDQSKEYCPMAVARIKAVKEDLRLF
ncbi:unnamed protein product [marine sediment metagenome]|uniref:DNA methylase N-4/N-6 domain-containing protein n=1 Tax=marine sediment metagenome TaxID=412755 RepID=X1A823_9ZZZZ